MAFSHVQATEALEQLANTGTTASEFIYELLRIFAAYGAGQLQRVRDGRNNQSKDSDTVLIKKLVAYRAVQPDEDLYAAIEAMRSDAKTAKQAPRLYLASDGVRVVGYDPKENDEYDNSIELMWRDFEFFAPLAGIEKIQFAHEAEADVKSAELMAKLFDDIRRYNDIRDAKTVHSLNVFMSRLLFCFFAEDTGLFPGENLFTNTLRTHTKDDGSDLAQFIDRAFLAMSTDSQAVLDTLPDLYKVFPYVNGGLFKERYPIPHLSRRARTLIINCGEYNWREINPDIFGSMIQAVVTPEQRSNMGMHYTSVTNIDKLIRPLFLDELEAEFVAACAEAREKLGRGMHVKRAVTRLEQLLMRLKNIKFFDPACGSGNFLIIAYKRLRELEIRIWKALSEFTRGGVLPVPNIHLTQFYGIELDEYACDTATLSLWLAEHQMNVKFNEELGAQPETLPLKPSGKIVCGNACRLDWEKVCPHTPDEEVYIMGNPPYLGSSLQTLDQKEDMQVAIGSICPGYRKLDYIAVWFVKAAQYCMGANASYAFVTTNSISQGEQVALLWPAIFACGLEISFAYTSFKWVNNAKFNAAVTVAIIGLKHNPQQKYIIRGTKREVHNINPYLAEGENIIVSSRLTPLVDISSMLFGSKPADGGALILEKVEAKPLLEQPAIAGFIKKFVGSDNFINDFERYCIWVDENNRLDALNSEFLKERFEMCRQFRLGSKKEATKQMANYNWQFSEPRYKPTTSIIVPSVSSERREYIPIGFLDKDTIISNSAFAIYDAELWLFALLTSKMHNIWVRAVGGSLETRIRYSATLCYNTFPFPKLTTNEKKELEALAQKILNIREENFDLTLGQMYNPESMPADLRQAHADLDRAVERIYRAEPFASDDERLEHLFRLYAKMTKKN